MANRPTDPEQPDPETPFDEERYHALAMQEPGVVDKFVERDTDFYTVQAPHPDAEDDLVPLTPAPPEEAAGADPQEEA